MTRLPARALFFDGCARVPGLLTAAECDYIANSIARLPPGSGGSRDLLSHAWCAALAQRLRALPGVAECIPASFVTVQCTYFEKGADNNWLVPVHQDLSIPVARRIEHDALAGWARKQGGDFVHAPDEVLDDLVALRLHLDPCFKEDGPLAVVPGSHRHGRVTPERAVALKDATGLVVCEAAPGDAWLMKPLLLHASSKSSGSGRRRVLHFVYGPPRLPFGLAWPGATETAAGQAQP